MMGEHPDASIRRANDLADEQREREYERERRAEHAPALFDLPSSAVKGERVSTVMMALAWAVLHGPEDERARVAATLAELVLEASR